MRNLHGVFVNPLPLTRARARLSLCVTLAVHCSTPVNAQTPTERPLSVIESRIRAYVKAHEREQIELLEEAVNINSVTLNLAGVRAVGRMFEPEFAAIGFESKWFALPDAIGRAGHLF